ncbi:hypothetical protein ASD68_00765 [Rhodanobacter sp. Root627]|uniref:hypothetical protein n=1 Tax=Rhodanobacter sp. Root627 TaxID=1736572 RepID=UPI0006F2CB6C|nr:hypothetical protein [Rhodanobacter sp. Root627]KRA35030.1 hypothetical protein ASD68_00765 [Rhodanobacter sp. Root627]
MALLFEEAFEQPCGCIALIERPFELVTVQILRPLMESGDVHGSLLSGLAHAAGMSRSVFHHVPRNAGVPPGRSRQGAHAAAKRPYTVDAP